MYIRRTVVSNMLTGYRNPYPDMYPYKKTHPKPVGIPLL
jgi:hypothetical protein